MTANQHGAALLITMVLMLALAVVGASSARIALNAERAARAGRDRQIALLAAETALRDAERDIEGSAHAASFAPGAAAAWKLVDLAAGSDPRVTGYGHVTGATMQFGVGAMPAKLPRYVIDPLPLARAGEDASVPAQDVYRITAIGYGTRQDTWVVLQSVYRKVPR